MKLNKKPDLLLYVKSGDLGVFSFPFICMIIEDDDDDD